VVRTVADGLIAYPDAAHFCTLMFNGALSPWLKRSLKGEVEYHDLSRTIDDELRVFAIEIGRRSSNSTRYRPIAEPASYASSLLFVGYALRLGTSPMGTRMP
jgi:hypothetical protein